MRTATKSTSLVPDLTFAGPDFEHDPDQIAVRDVSPQTTLDQCDVKGSERAS